MDIATNQLLLEIPNYCMLLLIIYSKYSIFFLSLTRVISLSNTVVNRTVWLLLYEVFKVYYLHLSKASFKRARDIFNNCLILRRRYTIHASMSAKNQVQISRAHNYTVAKSEIRGSARLERLYFVDNV